MAKVPTVCAAEGCSEVSVGARCARHARPTTDRRVQFREQNRERPSPAAKGYGHRWRKVRERVLREEPICRVPGCMQWTAEVDHIVPKPEGSDRRENLQGLCKGHHSAKTARENAAGRRNYDGGAYRGVRS